MTMFYFITYVILCYIESKYIVCDLILRARSSVATYVSYVATYGSYVATYGSYVATYVSNGQTLLHEVDMLQHLRHL
ncbi:hypothetical protein H5410_022196 [Solanum commersonii]|uniref:Uncharacterized protein n=1 Tax=Solanum commersonii TaxID=4109 RepID=A0A9J5ZD93_SOLCO|nr:hypothetical protein H5410_022196 [Solanum commersonii]